MLLAISRCSHILFFLFLFFLMDTFCVCGSLNIFFFPFLCQLTLLSDQLQVELRNSVI